jgi:hypothetical protein
MRRAEPVPSSHLTLEQRGRRTYLAVCTGGHSYNNRLIGPPIVAARAERIAHTVKRRSDYPAMPSQACLSAEIRLEGARYILGNPDQ